MIKNGRNMNDKYLAIRDCIECVRGNNSKCGNPRYIFKFDDGTEVKTEANAGWVYGLMPCSSYENTRITFKYVGNTMTDFIGSKELA
jgi:hypothetical protein